MRNKTTQGGKNKEETDQNPQNYMKTEEDKNNVSMEHKILHEKRSFHHSPRG